MPISGSAILFKYSNVLATSGNSDTLSPTSPTNSSVQCIGNFISTAGLASGSNTLFDDINGDNNASHAVDYRCVFVHNSDPTYILYNAVVWVSADTSGGATIQLGVDSTSASPIGSSTAQATTIPTRYAAPSGVSFFAATSKDTGISIGNLAPGYCRAIWVQRSATGNALTSDSVALTVEGSSDA